MLLFLLNFIIIIFYLIYFYDLFTICHVKPKTKYQLFKFNVLFKSTDDSFFCIK